MLVRRPSLPQPCSWQPPWSHNASNGLTSDSMKYLTSEWQHFTFVLSSPKFLIGRLSILVDMALIVHVCNVLREPSHDWKMNVHTFSHFSFEIQFVGAEDLFKTLCTPRSAEPFHLESCSIVVVAQLFLSTLHLCTSFNKSTSAGS